jgi:hypothetical protein
MAPSGLVDPLNGARYADCSGILHQRTNASSMNPEHQKAEPAAPCPKPTDNPIAFEQLGPQPNLGPIYC